MPFSFPSTPTVGQQSTQNGRVYSWTGSAWELVAVPPNLSHSDISNSLTTIAQFSSSQNNLSLGSGGIIRISSTAAIDITGFVATSSGDARLLMNVGTFSITLKNASASSSASNRILCVDSSDFELKPNGSVAVVYDGTDSRWRAG